jgi:hypothetical protein
MMDMGIGCSTCSDRAIERDPASAAAEYLAEFRVDLESCRRLPQRR